MNMTQAWPVVAITVAIIGVLLRQMSLQRSELITKIDGGDTTLGARIDGLDTSLSARIDGLDTKLSARIDGLEAKLDARIDGLDTKLSARIDGPRRQGGRVAQ